MRSFRAGSAIVLATLMTLTLVGAPAASGTTSIAQEDSGTCGCQASEPGLGAPGASALVPGAGSCAVNAESTLTAATETTILPIDATGMANQGPNKKMNCKVGKFNVNVSWDGDSFSIFIDPLLDPDKCDLTLEELDATGKTVGTWSSTRPHNISTTAYLTSFQASTIVYFFGQAKAANYKLTFVCEV